MNNLASEAQKKLFFALGNDLGVDPIVLKERAKKKFNLQHFPQINSIQIKELLEAMQNKLQNIKHKNMFICIKCKMRLDLVLKPA